jgi:hypothetical protein
VNKILLFVVIFALVSGALFAGKAQDAELFEKGEELSYEGQIKHAQKLLEDPTSEEPVTSSDSSWDGTSLMLGMIWGAIGTGFFIYGKKQSKALFLICGIALFLVPYFVGNVLANTILGLVLTIVPFKIDM